MHFSEINRLLVFVGVLLFGLATGATAYDADELIGAYENAEGGFRNFLQLTPNGKGVMLVKKPNDEWHLVMAFDWSVDGNSLLQRNVFCCGPCNCRTYTGSALCPGFGSAVVALRQRYCANTRFGYRSSYWAYLVVANSWRLTKHSSRPLRLRFAAAPRRLSLGVSGQDNECIHRQVSRNRRTASV